MKPSGLRCLAIGTLVVVSGMTACESSDMVGPLMLPPLMSVPETVAASATSVSMQLVSRLPDYMSYGYCFDTYAERLTEAGWVRVGVTAYPSMCAAVGYTLSGFGSTASFPVPLTGATPPSVYRIRKRFMHKSGELIAASNAFRVG